MNGSGDEPRFKSKNQKKMQGDKKRKKFFSKKESDYKRNESLIIDERCEIIVLC